MHVTNSIPSSIIYPPCKILKGSHVGFLNMKWPKTNTIFVGARTYFHRRIQQNQGIEHEKFSPFYGDLMDI